MLAFPGSVLGEQRLSLNVRSGLRNMAADMNPIITRAPCRKGQPVRVRTGLIASLVAAALGSFVGPARAEPASAAAATVTVGYVGAVREQRPGGSALDEVPRGEGVEGARLAIAENETSGRFLGRRFALVEHSVPAGGDPAPAIRALAVAGVHFVVADLDGDGLERAAATPEAAAITIFNARAPDDRLRGPDCRPNVLHTAPSRAMLADGLAQYLAWKRWRRWFLIVGPSPGDRLYADAIRRSAARFGAQIVAEKAWTFQPGSGRADTGHVTLQAEIPSITQAPDHDVLVVADEDDVFGEYLIGRTARPRPVAGTHGLVATAWSPVVEQWGAGQLQNRFKRQAGRRMNAVDYAAWAGVRAVGEAVFRSGKNDLDAITAFLRSPDFALSGFKGQGQSFRAWDGQMRQPILITGPKLLVSASPQPGFLHRTSELDTLGVDREETTCKR
jgi:ABC transporter substrate binding protein (PQQ-dependent alcohol dehydrogenase system)